MTIDSSQRMYYTVADRPNLLTVAGWRFPLLRRAVTLSAYPPRKRQMSTTNTPPSSRKHRDIFVVEDFCSNQCLELKASEPYGQCPATVTMIHRAGRMYYQASLTPHDARCMAAQLMILADTAEQFEHEAELTAEQVVA